MKTPLSVHVLYHANNSEGEKIYSELYTLLCRDVNDPFSDGLDIPVYFATGDDDSEIKLAESSSVRRVILLFIDIHMFNSKVWWDKIAELVDNKDKNTLIVGVKQYKHSFSINKTIGEIQSIVVDNDPGKNILMFADDHWDVFTTQLFDLLVRFLSKKEAKKPITVFISHSKQGNGPSKSKDGEESAQKVREFLFFKTKLDSFFDVHDVLDGYKFGDQIKAHAGNSSLLILFTDSYSSREWCRIEALTAKEKQVPIVAVFMMKNKVDRVFPYIGNIPSMVFHEDKDWRKIINLLLRTTLDQLVEKELLKTEANAKTECLPFPPEAFNMSLLTESKEKVLYPEPPLGNEELDVLKRIARKMGRKINFCTPMSHSTEGINLKEKKIGISIAESADIKDLGIGEEMLKDLTIELTRHILKANGKMIYGGDLREKGFTELFRDLVKQYGQKEKTDPNVQYIKNYLSWPIYNDISDETRAEYLASRIDLVNATPGSAVKPKEVNTYISSKLSNEATLKWATSLTQMREESITESDARIIAGGKTQGSSGFMPGIAEEFMITYNEKKPIFLIGGFGGCARVLAKILEGEATASSIKYTAMQDAFYKKFYKWCETNGHKIVFDFFNHINIDGLNNGLELEDNKRLLHSTDLIEIVSLVLKGLKNKLK